MLIFGLWLRLTPPSRFPPTNGPLCPLSFIETRTPAKPTKPCESHPSGVSARPRRVGFKGVFRAVKADRRAAPINMNGSVDHALQAQRRPPSSHPQDAFEGNELAAVRGRPAARQPDTLPSSSQCRGRRKTLTQHPG